MSTDQAAEGFFQISAKDTMERPSAPCPCFPRYMNHQVSVRADKVDTPGLTSHVLSPSVSLRVIFICVCSGAGKLFLIATTPQPRE